MNRNNIRFNDLSSALKFVVVFGWVCFAFVVISFLIGFFSGVAYFY